MRTTKRKKGRRKGSGKGKSDGRRSEGNKRIIRKRT